MAKNSTNRQKMVAIGVSAAVIAGISAGTGAYAAPADDVAVVIAEITAGHWAQARSDYDLLAQADQQSVTNIQDLIDYEAASQVAAGITAGNWDAARTAYDLLTAPQQLLVNNFADLQTAESNAAAAIDADITTSNWASARTAFDAANGTVQGLVQNLPALQAHEQLVQDTLLEIGRAHV